MQQDNNQYGQNNYQGPQPIGQDSGPASPGANAQPQMPPQNYYAQPANGQYGMPAPNPYQVGAQPMPMGKDPGKTLGILSVVCSITVVLGLIGLILGIISMNKSKKAGFHSIVGIIGTVLSAISMLMLPILATLVIVTYQGIQTKAETSHLAVEALAAKSYAETYYAENGYYPADNYILSDYIKLSKGSSDIGSSSDINIVPGEPSSLNRTDIGYSIYNTGSGAQIYYFDSVKNNTAIKPLGNASTTQKCY